MIARRLLGFMALAVMVMTYGASYAGQIVLPDSGFTVPVQSMKEMREERVITQDTDFSCGSAAVATLLTFSYDMPTTEKEAFDNMWAVGDQEHIKQHGFSLLDMQKYLASRGMHAVGYQLSLTKLRRLHMPVIALINPHGYHHFVVMRGWRNNGAIVADPKLGLRRIAADDFQSMWNGIVFVLQDNREFAQTRFNDPRDMRLITRSTSSSGLAYGREGVGDFLMNLPMYNTY